jgi:ADP-heptose:LPS heptosyltransferase
MKGLDVNNKQQHTGNDEDSPLVMWLGDKLSSFIPNEPNAIFVRGCARRMPSHTRETLKKLYPNWQIVNEDRIYIGGSIEGVEDFEKDIAADLPGNPKILIMRDLGLGDVIMSLPAVKALRELLPKAHITYATNPGYFGLFAGLGIVDALIKISEVDIQDGPYDLVINWCRAFEDYKIERNRGRRVESFFKHIGLPVPEDVGKLNVAPIPSSEDTAFISGMLANAPGPYITYVLQAAAWNRTYPIWKARDVFRALHAAFPHHRIIVLDSQPEFDIYGQLDYVFPLCGRTTVMQAAAVIAKSDFVISPDTGLAHVAASTGVPVVVLGSTQQYDWRFDHYGGHVGYVLKENAAPCVPCWDWQRTPAKIKYCMKTKANVCMLSIDPLEIAQCGAMLMDRVGNGEVPA